MAEKRPPRLLLPVPVLLLVSAFGVMGRMVPAAPRAQPSALTSRSGSLPEARVTAGGPAVMMMPGTIGFTSPVQPGAGQFNIILEDGGCNSTAVVPPHVWDHRRAVAVGLAAPAVGESVTRNGFVVANTGRTVANPGGGAPLPVLSARASPGVPTGAYRFQYAPAVGAPFFLTFDVVAGGR